jgi:uncharacterized protein YecE (DUF72 family)
LALAGGNFAPWRGPFYPKGLVQAQELHYASRQLTSIEINSTFYGLQKPGDVPEVARRDTRRIRVQPQGAEIRDAPQAPRGR